MSLTLPKLMRVGHSPDADDAFMFYALAHDKIPMRGFQVQHVIEDIESLNQRALRGELEVTAVSCHAYAYLADRYFVMRSGSSVGEQYGPILVAPAAKAALASPSDLRGRRIAVPGKLTTAFLALQLFAKDFEPVFVPFDRIFEAVFSGAADYGLVIHEGQITYQEKGLCKVLDLGQWWHEEVARPLPLGVDVIRKDLGRETIESFTQLFKESIEYALAHRSDALDYALRYGRGISKGTGDRFVGMYVNHQTVSLSPEAEEGFQKLLERGFEAGILPSLVRPEFV